MGTTPFDFSQPNVNLDLTNLDLVHQYTGVRGGAEDTIIQLCITAASVSWIWMTGRGPEGYVPAQSPFVSPQAYDEFYDGNGSARQFVRNWPITAVTGLYVGGQSISASSGGQPGFLIDQSKKSISITGAYRQHSFFSCPPNLGRTPGGFPEGIQNVEVQYTAGFSMVPPDVVMACTKMVSVNYRRKEWLDKSSESMTVQGGGAGTTSYRSWAIPPDVALVIKNYSRDYAI